MTQYKPVTDEFMKEHLLIAWYATCTIIYSHTSIELTPQNVF